MAPSVVNVVRSPPQLRPAAIRLLHDALPPDQRVTLVAALDSVDADDSAAWDDLWIATQNPNDNEAPSADEILAAAWLQPLPGRAALLWIGEVTGAPGQQLLRAIAESNTRTAGALVQLIVNEDRPELAASLVPHGFKRLATLAYLFVVLPVNIPVNAEPSAPSADDCTWIPRAAEQPVRLARVLEATYVNTQDCPDLDGVRDLSDVIEGYRAIGRYLPDEWYFVERDGRDVGALILADHPTSGNWELVYMGVVAEARGQGLGLEIVRQAIRAAERGGAERLVLAVDAGNEPGLAVYRAAGFREWDVRTIYALS